MRRVQMRRIEEALRLKALGLSTRRIASSVGVGQSTVVGYLRRAERAGLAWPLPAGVGEAELERRLFPGDAGSTSRKALAVPDWPRIDVELRRKGVTLALLWEEYREACPEGYGYAHFCALHGAWRRRTSPWMRQRHVAGERLFVDYAGQTVGVADASTGGVREARIFVGVLGASNYTYAEATWTEGLSDWIGSHERMLAFYGGVPELLVPDNLRSGVSKACRYEPVINATYRDMSEHYGTAVLPARARKPRDKAKVEAGVLLVERWILARLRNRTLFSLSELNAAVRELTAVLNGKRMRDYGASRRELFEQLDRPALKPLPSERYEYAEFLVQRVANDYHVRVGLHRYSVPHRLLTKEVTVRVTERTVEVLHRGRRVTSHVRAAGDVRGETTERTHMPERHRRHADMTPARILCAARAIGPHALSLVERIVESRPHPEPGYRAGLGIVRLAREHGREDVDAACLRALEIRGLSLKSVRSILSNNLHRRKVEAPAEGPAITHSNIRGADYFH